MKNQNIYFSIFDYIHNNYIATSRDLRDTPEGKIKSITQLKISSRAHSAIFSLARIAAVPFLSVGSIGCVRVSGVFCISGSISSGYKYNRDLVFKDFHEIVF